MSEKIAVIGAGPMGLACAYQLLKQGHEVDIFEHGERIGGMSASFDFEGLNIERFYHFICATDHPYFDLLKDLGIFHLLRWRATKMGFFYEGRLYSWSDPVSLLRFPHLSLLSKLRYSANILYSKYLASWEKLDRIDAIQWLKRWLGAEGYRLLWESLLRLKYHEYRHHISAAWIASRIRRVAYSRESLFTEKLGYMEGGSDAFLDALHSAIVKLGGKIHLNAPVKQVSVVKNRAAGLIVGDREIAFTKIISTIPLPYIPSIVPDLPADALHKIASIVNIGVVCVIFKLKTAFSENFWTNINDARLQIPGLIEYSNLCPMPNGIVYIPYYLPQNHPYYSRDNQAFIDESIAALCLIKPSFSHDDIVSVHVSRYHYAQTVCPPGFFAALPPMRSAIEGFFMADTAYYYPEDRSISESVKLGNTLAELAMEYR
jgi:protoporphyrinogen oxidase